MSQTAPLTFSIEALNRASESQAAAMMDRIVERSAWLAHRAARARPFRDAAELGQWLEREVTSLAPDAAVEFLCAHPELAPPDPAAMTPASQSEQARLDLSRPAPQVAARLADLNRAYTRRHGYPFVIALHARRDLDEVFDEFEARLVAETDDERARALAETVSVMKARLTRLVTGEADATPSPSSCATEG